MLAEHHGHAVFAKRSHSFAVRVRLMQPPAGLSEELSQEKIIRHRSTNRQNGERSFSYAHSCSIGINDEVGLASPEFVAHRPSSLRGSRAAASLGISRRSD